MGLLNAFSGNPAFQQQLQGIINQQSPGYQGAQMMAPPAMATQMPAQTGQQQGLRNGLAGLNLMGGGGMNPMLLNLLQQQSPWLSQQNGVQPNLGMSR